MFGSVAAAYDRLRPGYPDAAVDWLLDPAARTVAEIAAGTGKLTDSLVARRLTVVAVEPDAAMLAVLRRRHPTVTAHRAPAEQLPLADASVDAVVVAQAWHWFDPVRAWSEVRRILRPGGRLGLIGHIPTPTQPWEHELAAMDLSRPAPVDPHAGPEPDAPGPAGVRTETASFPWVRRITPDDLAELYGTYSAYAVLPPAERRRRLMALAAVARAEAHRRGTATVPLTSLVRVDRVYPD
ncbi:class I SAM-dependent methyltransferase [Nakamurella deserti]|uniref:class I SAM-dependent methyltransferase n=1 Tax=Nakamurella deserti TaxID=2164074 RepID=UPI00197C2E05|nr:class I SAM-dependent methyltransferase [Nakamurella deserti]